VLKAWRWLRQRWKRHAGALAVAFAVLALGFGVVVVVQAAMLHTKGWRIALGTVPVWLAAFGTLVAIVAVLIAAKGYQHQVRVRADDERERALAERRRQAELLSGWLISHGGTRLAPATGDAPRSIVNVADVGLINASEVVLYDVIVVAVCEHHKPMPVAYSMNDIRFTDPVAWDPKRDRLACGRAKVLPPGHWKVALRLATTSVAAIDLHLFFRDHQGVYWWRDAAGHITEQPPPTPDDRDGKGRIRQIEAALGEGPTDGRVGILVPKPLTDAEAT
jgi:hypothetical protein